MGTSLACCKEVENKLAAFPAAQACCKTIGSKLAGNSGAPTTPGFSADATAKLQSLFKLMDKSNANAASQEEMAKFVKQRFPKVNVDDIFKRLKIDQSPTLNLAQYLEVMESVLSSGHSQEEVIKEINDVMARGCWGSKDAPLTEPLKPSRKSVHTLDEFY
eukprot:gnl/TRDRNA2_/TRDRNA2_197260_c0_seq1.p1 gnl/TRDRNA2_/TRDRNA2_197260_c0~~gnl/TRDRNA2_/TRDRNA2_197260_c0_seq1.p1  ORF type:complete len:161 (+),score=30.87 gnl/TRDRNA2_/TRDRNA2_197260_c0_seq1:86-568(+)